jgi:hypothetical protein
LPSGDGNRIWYPDMIDMLRSQWNESMTHPKLVELCEMLDRALQQHRPTAMPSLPPGSRCPKCGRIVKAEGSGPYRISVGAAILALGRFGIASPELTKRLEKEWAKYRTEKQLDLYGCPAEGHTAGNESSRVGCAHPYRVEQKCERPSTQMT